MTLGRSTGLEPATSRTTTYGRAAKKSNVLAPLQRSHTVARLVRPSWSRTIPARRALRASHAQAALSPHSAKLTADHASRTAACVRGPRVRAERAWSSRRRGVQLVAHGLPGDVIVRVRERFARTPLDLAGPRGLYVCVGLAIQAREQVGRKLRALGERQLHRVVQQLACAVGHNSSIPARRHATLAGSLGRDDHARRVRSRSTTGGASSSSSARPSQRPFARSSENSPVSRRG